MITVQHSNRQASATQNPPNWQQQLAQAVTTVDELLTILELSPQQVNYSPAANAQFSLRVPHGFLQRFRKGDPHCPLLRQVLPLFHEEQPHPQYIADPLGEKDANPIPGLIHKYRSRVLLTVSRHCGIHCRYCFRRHFPYQDNNPGRQGWSHALDYIQQHPEINEVILSGGDPLSAPDHYLADLTTQLNTLPQLTTLRIHSRLPIVIPERITPELVAWFTQQRLQPVLVLHCNHPQELDPHTGETLQRLQQHGVTLLNQTVLLKHVNNCLPTLERLCNLLFKYNILPYYLHCLDKVAGAQHFDIPQQEAQTLLGQLMQQLPGYLVPKLVLEQAGMPCKVPLAPNW